MSSSSSSTRSSSSTPYLGGGGKKGSFRGGGRPPRSQQHQQTSGSTYVQPEIATFIPSPSSAVGQGGFVIQTQPFGLRPSVHTPPAAGQGMYLCIYILVREKERGGIRKKLFLENLFCSVISPPVYYTHVPQYPGAAGLIAQPGMIPPQQVTVVISHMIDHMTTILSLLYYIVGGCCQSEVPHRSTNTTSSDWYGLTDLVLFLLHVIAHP